MLTFVVTSCSSDNSHPSHSQYNLENIFQTSTLEHRYYEDYDIGFDVRIPSTPSIDWLISQNRKSHNTNSFEGNDDLLIVRRASSFSYVVSAGRNSSIVSVKSSLTGSVEDNSNDSLNSDSAVYPDSKISCESDVEGNTRYTVKCTLSSDAPIGSYTLTSKLQYADADTGAPVYEVSETRRIVILVNPYVRIRHTPHKITLTEINSTGTPPETTHT